MKRNAITYLLQEALQERINGAKIYVEWGGKSPERGFVIEKSGRRGIDIRLDNSWFVNEIDIIELWRNLKKWVDWWNAEEAESPSRQARLDEFFDVNTGNDITGKQTTLDEWF
tara:strand:+ start:1645 stop:1983 length:339 start_codon:yes stop_codon:yes gene_type:complete